MHSIVFDIKRLHLTGQRHMLAALKWHGLTPARFDVLRLVMMGVRRQSDICRALGLARSTVSRMLTAMERRGLIRRTARAPQRAPKRVRMTHQIYRRFIRLFQESRVALEAAVRHGVGIPAHALVHYFRFAARASTLLGQSRYHLGDRADGTVLYESWEFDIGVD
ncbi:MAG: MarR family transcriptional regulator [Polyangiaceae bacterium]